MRKFRSKQIFRHVQRRGILFPDAVPLPGIPVARSDEKMPGGFGGWRTASSLKSCGYCVEREEALKPLNAAFRYLYRLFSAKKGASVSVLFWKQSYVPLRLTAGAGAFCCYRWMPVDDRMKNPGRLVEPPFLEPRSCSARPMSSGYSRSFRFLCRASSYKERRFLSGKDVRFPRAESVPAAGMKKSAAAG